eukprot:10728030-Alexandrium_andersonii.AAC.1
MVQQCSCLLRPDPLLRKIDTSRKRIARLRRRRPERISGRQAFPSSLCGVAKRWRAGSLSTRTDFGKTVMRHHGKRWAAKP